MKISKGKLRQVMTEIIGDDGRVFDPQELERFPDTAASVDEMLHSDIVSSVYDAIIDTALLNAGKDRENIVLTGIDNELESREMDGEEVDMSQIDLQQVFRDVMLDIEKAEQRSMKEERSLKISKNRMRQIIQEELNEGGIHRTGASAFGAKWNDYSDEEKFDALVQQITFNADDISDLFRKFKEAKEDSP